MKLKGKMFFGLLAVLTLSIAMLSPTAVFADGDSWTQFHGDVAHTGYSSSEAPDTANLKWVSADIGAVSSSSVVIADGKIFAFGGGDTSSVVCLDQSDGSTIWNHSITPSAIWGSWGTPAYDNGMVFVATDGIYCLDADDGHQIWKYTFPSGSSACDGGVTVVDGKVIAGDWDGHHYYCVNETDGNYLWTYTVGGYAQGTPAYHNGKFFLTSWAYPGGNVYCVDAATGSLVWHSDGVTDGTYDWDTCGSVTVAEGKCFFTTYNFGGYGELMALNEADGSVAWGPKQIERSDSTPAYYDGKIYVCGGCSGYSDEGARTYCFNASDGSLVWRTPTTLGVGDWTCSVAVADGKVFVGKPDPVNYFDYLAIYALDITDGSEVWHYDSGGASPAVSDGVVYTIGSGKVWAFGSTHPAWDVNSDGAVNVLDMSLVGDRFGETGNPGWIAEDINSDGVINVLDMSLIGDHFGE